MVVYFDRVKQISSKAYQMQKSTGLDFEECVEILEAIRKEVGDFCFWGANERLYKLILGYRQEGYPPRRAAFKALQDFYCQN
ncbi:MAG: hypothetical protein IGR93_00515 [Hydrococcus sp. C42_A2020_068]|nr:hypothetical protein Ple7327_3471 [Pleurocapsa sp. PCC 7327]MBF2018616.1 hypothetical protein [Hydrococcus sp. C42_A2020_068]